MDTYRHAMTACAPRPSTTNDTTPSSGEHVQNCTEAWAVSKEEAYDHDGLETEEAGTLSMLFFRSETHVRKRRSV